MLVKMETIANDTVEKMKEIISSNELKVASKMFIDYEARPIILDFMEAHGINHSATVGKKPMDDHIMNKVLKSLQDLNLCK